MSAALLPIDKERHAPALTPIYKSSLLRAPQHAPLVMPSSMTETSGPVFDRDIIGPLDNDLILNYARPDEMPIGQRTMIHGRVIDENDRPVPDALIEIWQANAGGRYRHARERYIAPLDPNFGGCGRTMTDSQGRYSFRTIKPGAYPFPNGPNDWRPAHVHFSVFGAAFAQRLVTQMYFEGDPLIDLCPIVQTLPSQDAIKALIGMYDRDTTLPMDAGAYRFDIVLRGRHATPFENQL